MKYLFNEIKPNFDYIYMIANSEGYFKVGISKHPEKRLRQLQTGNQNNLKLIFTEEFECNRNKLLKIEALIHKEISSFSKHMKGEWFKIDEKDVERTKNIIQFARIRYDSDPFAFKYFK